jgi:hypothetical protein
MHKKVEVWETPERPRYVQVVNCGKFGYAIWDFPQTHTFYPAHPNNFDEACQQVINNGYRLVSHTEKRTIFEHEQRDQSVL